MAQVYISIGSNIGREDNILSCMRDLRGDYGDLTVSTVYESKAVGFEGRNFYNLAVGFETDQDVQSLADNLRRIEHRHGRRREDGRLLDRTLDLDLLLYDDLVLDDAGLELPRGEITRYAFVLQPLAEIAGDVIHPVEGVSIRDLWRRFDRDGQALWAVKLDAGEERGVTSEA